jgi:hypothetical protein
VLHGDRKPPSVFLVIALVPGRRICIVGECLRGCGGTTLFHHPAKRTTWRAELRPYRGVALLGGDIAGTGSTSFGLAQSHSALPRCARPHPRQPRVPRAGPRSHRVRARRRVSRMVDICPWRRRPGIVRPEAIFASSSAVLLYRRATWLSSSPWNLSSKRRTSSQ